MTPSYVWHDSFVCVTWRIYECDTTYLYASMKERLSWLIHSNTVCKTLQHTATHCNILQHTATHCNRDCHDWFTLTQYNTTSAHSNTYVHNSHQERLSWIIRCNTLQRSCNTMQHIYIQHTGAEEQIVMTHLLQHTATQLQHSCNTNVYYKQATCHDSFIATHCNTAATHCNTSEWVMSHIWMGHVIHMNESCHTFEWVMLHIGMSHFTHQEKGPWRRSLCACHTHEWVMSHI